MARCDAYNDELELLHVRLLNHDILQELQPMMNRKLLNQEIADITTNLVITFEAKDSDYAANGLPMGNLRESEEMGIPPWIGTLLRIGDKKRRIQSFASRGTYAVKSEAVDETMIDLGNYALLGCVLFNEDHSSANFDHTRQTFRNLAVTAIRCALLYRHGQAALETGVKNFPDWRATAWRDLQKEYQKLAEIARAKKEDS